MMYNNQFVCCVKANGKILREFTKGEIKIPFGTEFSILLKNLSNVRAVASIYIDGQDVSPGNQFVIPSKNETEITRFVSNGNMSQGNSFKFIERTGNIEEHRGIKMEDGLIRIEFQFEKPKPFISETHEHHHYHYDHYPINPWIGQPSRPNNPYRSRGFVPSSGDSYSQSLGKQTASDAVNGMSNFSASASAGLPQNRLGISETTMDFMDMGQDRSTQINEVGITVPGSVSNQRFKQVSAFTLESQVHTMIFKLSGFANKGNLITKPIDVKVNTKCSTCGRTNKATSKFCTDCGTSLTLI